MICLGSMCAHSHIRTYLSGNREWRSTVTEGVQAADARPYSVTCSLSSGKTLTPRLRAPLTRPGATARWGQLHGAADRNILDGEGAAFTWELENHRCTRSRSGSSCGALGPTGTDEFLHLWGPGRALAVRCTRRILAPVSRLCASQPHALTPLPPENHECVRAARGP